MKRVCLVFESVRAYRTPFLTALRKRLRHDGIVLDVIYGEPGVVDRLRGDWVDVPWGVKIQNRTFSIFGRELFWQPCLRETRYADLVVIEQVARHLVNYVFLLRYSFHRQRVGIWGHGRNFRNDESSPLVERVKAGLSRRVHWWFAYNDESARIVESLGFPRDRITSVGNSIDVGALQSEVQSCPEGDRRRIMESLGIGDDGFTCVYLGSLVPMKRLDFLLEAADRVQQDLPGFQLVMVGTGSLRSSIEQAASTRSWLHVIGSRIGREKAAILASARLLLVPYGIGLVALDSLAAGVPLICVDAPNHGPEFDYLESGRTAIVLESGSSSELYAGSVSELLNDDVRLERLRASCLEESRLFSIDRMVESYAQGVIGALEAGWR